MITLTHDGRLIVIECDSRTAGILQNLLCVARPQGAAELGELRVIVHDDDTPAPQPKHKPIEAL